jgi:hypothetical protein
VIDWVFKYYRIETKPVRPIRAFEFKKNNKQCLSLQLIEKLLDYGSEKRS